MDSSAQEAKTLASVLEAWNKLFSVALMVLPPSAGGCPSAPLFSGRSGAPYPSKCSTASARWSMMSMDWGHMASQVPHWMHFEAGPSAACQE